VYLVTDGWAKWRGRWSRCIFACLLNVCRGVAGSHFKSLQQGKIKERYAIMPVAYTFDVLPYLRATAYIITAAQAEIRCRKDSGSRSHFMLIIPVVRPLKQILSGGALESVSGIHWWRNNLNLRNRVNWGDVFSFTGLVVALADAYICRRVRGGQVSKPIG
jgi:hypothetical protein